MKIIFMPAVVLVALLALLPSCRSPESAKIATIRKAAEQGDLWAQYRLDALEQDKKK